MANSDIVSICVDYISQIYRLHFLSFWLYMFYISVLMLITLLVYRFVNHCSQNKESCHLPKMFSQPIWNPDTSQGFASVMTRFSFSRFSFSWFPFFRFSLFCFYSISIFMFFFLYHLSLLLSRSYFLSIGSPIHLCFIFSLSRCLITRLRYKLMPHLCFPCAFLPSGPAASNTPFPIFGISVYAACLCTSIFSSAPSRLSAWI